ncbi:Uncharacterised protein [Acinetobacter haemolyticus]|uniref:Uncharacterized protein n=2 Tax=Acinetobacter haemolyticus TaxID=29430 RepID=N9GQR2_ACIHA|nr:hypothetical protein F927_01211 [Acinetobacter haemolyticus CIP 64.3 = MTCC 9819]SPT46686.1 Uncharacterised protein [Acinetobacter haemolyticus]SUU59532.1 Uncharacterised protein [Acinetobacter haemolyticus]
MKNLEMKNLTPDLYAPINPNEGAAGFRLGMQYADFLEQTVHLFINDYLAESIGDNFWRVYEQKEFNEITQIQYNFNYCYWNDSVVLVFNGDSSELESIQLYSGYKGALFDEYHIGDKLSKIHEKFNFYFYADVHYLIDNNAYIDSEEDPVLIEGIALKTDYLIEYSSAYSDHVVEQTNVFKV